MAWASVGLHDLYRRNAELHPEARSSLVCAYEDSVMTDLYTVLNRDIFDSPLHMRQALHDLADAFVLGGMSPRSL